MENLTKLQRYLERLQFEATCLRLWSNGIQDQIMDETQTVHANMMRMTEELNRARRSPAPGWLPINGSQGPVSLNSHQLQRRVQHRLYLQRVGHTEMLSIHPNIQLANPCGMLQTEPSSVKRITRSL